MSRLTAAARIALWVGAVGSLALMLIALATAALMSRRSSHTEPSA